MCGRKNRRAFRHGRGEQARVSGFDGKELVGVVIVSDRKAVGIDDDALYGMQRSRRYYALLLPTDMRPASEKIGLERLTHNGRRLGKRSQFQGTRGAPRP